MDASHGDAIDDFTVIVPGERRDLMHHFRAWHVPGDVDALGQRPHAQGRLGKLAFQQFTQLLRVGTDHHVQGRDLPLFIPEVELRHTRREGRNLDLIRSQRRRLDDPRVRHEQAGNLLVELENLAGADRHLQPLPRLADAEFRAGIVDFRVRLLQQPRGR